jgi:hypothetical protein
VLTILLAFALLNAAHGRAQTPHPPLKHFVFFGRDRARIADSAFLANPNIAGAQIKYTWRELEPRRDRYDFAAIAEDLSALARHHKRLWIQLQDVSFGAENRVVPDYLLDDPAFSGGVADQYEGKPPNTRFVGRMARRWDPAVRARFARLLDTLGRAFDGKIDGLNLAETSFSIGDAPATHPAGFTYDGYAKGIRASMSAAHAAFPRSRVIVYANFMPGEWLPDDDHGYLRGIYAYADSIGVGVGGPDLLPFRRGQRNHSLRFIAARGANTVAGLAVQDGNLAERNPVTGERASVEALVRYATDTLRLDYIFWGTEEPYYSKEVLPWLAGLVLPAGRLTSPQVGSGHHSLVRFLRRYLGDQATPLFRDVLCFHRARPQIRMHGPVWSHLGSRRRTPPPCVGFRVALATRATACDMSRVRRAADPQARAHPPAPRRARA